MIDIFSKLIDTEGFMPHGHCYLWTPSLVYTNVISDSVIFASYLSISLMLVFLVQKVKEIPFHSIYLSFGAFIVACAFTHFMEIINVWTPTYWLSASVKVITATASLGTAIALPFYFTRIRDLARGAVLLKTQNALKESEAMYKQIVDTANEGIWLVDLNYNTTFLNQQMASMLGYSVEELIGRCVFEFLDESGRREIVRINSEHVHGSIDHNHDFRMFTKDGSEIFTRIACNPLVDAQGHKTGSLGMVTNVTKKRQAQEKLRLSEIHFRSLIEGVPQLIWSALSDGSKDYANQNLCDHLGFVPSDVIEELLSAIHEDERQGTRRLWTKAFETGESVECEYRLIRHDGVYRWQLGRILPLRDDTGAIVRWLGIATDIDNLKRAEQAQYRHRLSEKAALEASRLKSEFLANMSHEIRTPLNGVIGMMTLLHESDLTPEQREYAESGRSSSEALLSVVDEILDFSKIEAGKLELEAIDFDLKSLVRSATDSLDPSLRNKGINLCVNLDPDLPAFLNGDPARLRQVINNLLGNALKFTAEGTITLNLWKVSDSTIQCEVIDTGVGISEDALPRLFRDFSQADSSTTRKFGGTGLGLSICKRLIESMGGAIGVDSTDGKGSRFWFTIPLRLGIERAPTDTAFPMRSKWSDAWILVADDNAINRKVVLKFITTMGFKAESVSNGLEVLQAVAKRNYDLILLDCHMPEMDGYECARVLRSSMGSGIVVPTPIVALTASAMKSDQDRCREAGMDAHIAKPIRKNQLFEVVERLIDQSRALNFDQGLAHSESEAKEII